MKRRIGWLTVIVTLVVVPLMAGCGDGHGSAGPDRGVSVGGIQQKNYLYEGEYLGKKVTVNATVSEVHGSRSFDLSGGDFDSDTLLVMTSQPVEVAKGQVVRVAGTVGQLHFSSPSERVPYTQRDLYTKYETKAYLYDATVEPLPAGQQGNSGR